MKFQEKTSCSKLQPTRQNRIVRTSPKNALTSSKNALTPSGRPHMVFCVKEFYCHVCGHYPWALVMDFNRKTAFKMLANEINTDSESDEVTDLDEVNMDKIWEEVELNIISRSFS